MSAHPGFADKVRIALEVARERGVIYFGSFVAADVANTVLYSANHLFSGVYAKVFHKPLIYVVGDSHSWAFKRNPGFIVRNIGPATAFNLNNKNSTIRSHEKLFRAIEGIDKKRDIVVTVFGEIDCRVHIYNQFMKNGGKPPMTAIMDKAIANYGQVLKTLREGGVNLCVYGVIPASPGIFRYTPYATARMKKEEFDDFQGRYPHLADIETRIWINREFNERLMKYCDANGYKYINIYSHVSNEKGLIRDEFVADEIHVNGKIMPFIKGWFRDNYGL